VRTHATGKGVCIEVEDTGVGIPEENLERIFDPGFTTKNARVGMGLGLLLAREVMDRHGGRIEVRSQHGRGSTFTLILPYNLPHGGA
jgi:signal transduction histidine kinase